jgi:hypothetical protein
MAIMIRIVKNTFRKLLPGPIRYSPIVAKLKPHVLGHNWIYDSDYYEIGVEGPAVRSAGRIADSILNDFKATCIIDGRLRYGRAPRSITS